MLLRFKFPAETRERYGLPEVCEYDADRPRLSEVRALSRQAGLTFPQMRDKLKAFDWEGMGVLFWLVVLRHTAQPPAWEDFDVDLDGVEMEEPDGPGNSPAPDGASSE